MMQSYLSIGTTAFLTLEIGFFLLCAIGQFKQISFSVVVSASINLILLFLVHQFFQFNDHFLNQVNMALIGVIPFLILSLVIFSLDLKLQKSQKNLAYKLPFLGAALGYYLSFPYFFCAMLVTLGVLFTMFWKHRHRYRLYLRSFVFILIFIFLFFTNFLLIKLSLFNFFFIFCIIYYLNQLLNLMMVKHLLSTKLGEPS